MPNDGLFDAYRVTSTAANAPGEHVKRALCLKEC